MWVVLAGVVLAIVFYCWDRFPIEVVSASVVAVIMVFFHAFPLGTGNPTAGQLLSGFANPALITILALLIVGHGIFQTGAMDGPTRWMLASYEQHPRTTLLAMFAFVFAVSAFINNTPVVVMFVPVLAAIAKRMEQSPSKLMIPLSYVCILAGMTTLIGSSTNLLVADSLFTATGSNLGFFAPTGPGLFLASVGLLYILIFLPKMLPERASMEEALRGGDGRQYIAQLEVTADHPLFGKSPVAGMFTDLPDMTVRMIQRGEGSFLPPFEDVSLQPGDLIIVAATRKTLTDTLSSQPELLRQMWQSREGADSDGMDEDGGTPRLMLVEAVVAPGSRMIGRAIEQLGFRRLTNTLVLGVQRRSRMMRARLGEIRLEAGDTLLLCGSSSSFRELRASRDLLLLEWSQVELPATEKSHYARWITLGVVVLAATGLLEILHASVIGAVAMILTGCLNIRQATRSLDLRIFTLIAAAIAMGTALENTGAALALAQGVVNFIEPFGTVAVLSVLFLVVAVLTNVLSNSATAVLFTPIAIQAANLLGVDPKPFVLAVIYAANCCFATPIAYQTNLLVMGPGHYKFLDYLRFGGPLVIVLWLVFTFVAPLRFDL